MKVKIETLTPVHIGSGNFLHYNTEFFPVTVTEKSSGKKYRCVRIIDERKILDLIGPKHLQDWLLSIERGQNIMEFMKVFAPDAKTSDYSRRRVFLYGEVKEKDTLKECIHNGMGLPYIPGSSIKGALRTAITAILAHKKDDLEDIAKVYYIKDGEEEYKYDGYCVENSFYGSDPNHDIFRFLRCGDAYFPVEKEIVFRLQMYLNITKDKSLVPKIEHSKPQLIEALGEGAQSEFQLHLDTDHYDGIITLQPNAVGELPDEMKSVEKLFAAVNKHTLDLVCQEIDFWSDIDKTGADCYVEQMENMAESIRDEIKKGNKSCILRIGHAIGWDFITGGWARDFEDFELVKDQARYKNYNYRDYVFPKSRRLDTDGEMIGFVKLSL